MKISKGLSIANKAAMIFVHFRRALVCELSLKNESELINLFSKWKTDRHSVSSDMHSAFCELDFAEKTLNELRQEISDLTER